MTKLVSIHISKRQTKFCNKYVSIAFYYIIKHLDKSLFAQCPSFEDLSHVYHLNDVSVFTLCDIGHKCPPAVAGLF